MSNMYPRSLRCKAKKLNKGNSNYFKTLKYCLKKKKEKNLILDEQLAKELSTNQLRVVSKPMSDEKSKRKFAKLQRARYFTELAKAQKQKAESSAEPQGKEPGAE